MTTHGLKTRIGSALMAKEDKERKDKEMENEKKEVKLAAPWVQYANALKALFKHDPEISVSYDEENNLLVVKVDNPAKAEALSELLPAMKTFGNVDLWISVVPSNVQKTKAELFRTAFDGNPAFRGIIPIEGAFSNPMLYVIFKKEVVQYYNDNLCDPHGNFSTLYQDIAREIFKNMDGVFYCTDNMDETK